MHKYFAWIDERGYWRGQKLVELRAVANLRRSVSTMQHFASTQTYDDAGNVMFCPLYADLDGKIEDAQRDAQFIVHLLGELCSIVPDIYFSGSKGFHIIIPHLVRNPQCHLIARYFYEYLAKDLPTLDKRVYRTRAMLRLPGSPASKSGHYKVQITRRELMNLTPAAIVDLSKAPRVGTINECDVEKVNDEFLQILVDAEANLPKYREPLTRDTSFDESITFCIDRMIEEEPGVGERNRVIQLLVRFLKSVGVGESDAAAFLLARPHWKEIDHDRSVTKVVKSIYASKRPSMIGCRNGIDADLMQAHCHSLCWFNRERMEIRFGRPEAGKGGADHITARTLPGAPRATAKG